MSDDHTPRINVGYPLAQLLKALSGTGEQAPLRARQWQQVLFGLVDGTLRVGSRTPVKDIPPWVTLEVVHGGFATGNTAAAGPLQPHEIQKLRSVAQPGQAADRGALNLYFLSDLGRPELAAMLATGGFRVRVPEEAALLVAAWLLERGEAERAAALIDTIVPFFDQLRFYPMPRPRPAHSGTGVYIQTVGETIKSLRARRPQASVERMNEAVRVWTPLYDRAVGLFLETVDGDLPALQAIGSGELQRGPDGQPLVAGGWPCRHYPAGWAARGRQLLADYEHARVQHTLCGKHEKPKENFARLRGYMAACVEDPRLLTGRDVGMIRKILASSVTRHGAPGSDRLRVTRAMQAHIAARPLHHVLASVLAERLRAYPEDEGVPEVDGLLGPLSADEAVPIDALVGEPLPPAVIATAARCLEAPLDILVARRIVASSEVMAGLLPLVTARTRAAAIADQDLGRVYEAVYLAFRRRRSLLLLDLESQVRLSELPWVSAVEPWVGSDGASRDAARATLVRSAALAVEAFPHTILPNKLIRELQALTAGAGLSLPLVFEVAADIFMGAFSDTFLRAAQVAATVLRGSLYERYYGLPYEAVMGLNDVEKSRFGAPTSAGFVRLCEELARAADHSGSRSVARNGTIIEQAEILTTHNLAVLFSLPDLEPALRPKLPLLARRCFAWMCQRQQQKISDWRADLRMMKNTAYAWRQMLFYLSLLDQAEVDSFLDWSASHLNGQRDEFRQRFTPVMAGLTAVAGGEHFDPQGYHAASGGQRFLGWSVGRHWLRPQSDVKVSPY